MDGTDEFIFEWPPTVEKNTALRLAISLLKAQASKHWCGTCADYYIQAAKTLERLLDGPTHS